MLLEWNPWNMWKESYDYMEKNYSESMQQQMQEESFAQWMDWCQRWYLFHQDMHNQMMRQWFQQWKAPSKEDIAVVSSLVVQVEEKLDALEDRIELDIMEQLQEIRHALAQLQEKG